MAWWRTNGFRKYSTVASAFYIRLITSPFKCASLRHCLTEYPPLSPSTALQGLG